MGGITLWARSLLRRGWGATVFMVLLLGLGVGISGAAAQAWRRADGAIQRRVERNRSFDVGAAGCPPGVDPDHADFEVTQRECLSPAALERFQREVLSGVPGVEASGTLTTKVVGILDPTAVNGWGRLILTYAGSGVRLGVERAQLIVGRPFDDGAGDEIVIGERAAAQGHLHVGDRLMLAAWTPEHLDLAVDGLMAPETEPFPSTVVGIVRALTDIEGTDTGPLTDTALPDALYAGAAWFSAHGSDLPGYGDALAVRLSSGPSGAGAFDAALAANPEGWRTFTYPIDEFNSAGLQRALDAERQALLVFVVIALLAVGGFGGLVISRQLNRELRELDALGALGMTRRDLATGLLLRMVVVAGGGVVVALAAMVSLSPLTPLGIARRLEYSTPVRLDLVVAGFVVVALAALAGLSALAAVRSATAGRRHVRVPRAGVFGRHGAALGPVPRAGLNFAGGGSPRVAVVVGAIAVGLTCAAGGLVGSFDRVNAQPARYGVWWDVAVGEYSSPEAFEAGLARLRANPLVAAAGGALEDPNSAMVDGRNVPFLAIQPEIGSIGPQVRTGRAPVEADEAALAVDTAAALGKGIGDTVLVGPKDAESSFAPVELTVVGLVAFADPVSSRTSIGTGIVIPPAVAAGLGSDVPQSIGIRFVEGADRDVALASIVRDFPGSARVPSLPTDLRNLGGLRFVPWVIALLVAALALGALLHALVTLLQRHSRDLAVFAALGFTRGQRLRVGMTAGTLLAGSSVVIGVPGGIVLGQWLWRVVAGRTDVLSGPAVGAGAPVAAAVGALVIAVIVSWLTARVLARRSPAALLRSE